MKDLEQLLAELPLPTSDALDERVLRAISAAERHAGRRRRRVMAAVAASAAALLAGLAMLLTGSPEAGPSPATRRIVVELPQDGPLCSWLARERPQPRTFFDLTATGVEEAPRP